MPIKYNRNNSIVKVIFTDNGKIIYFSRADTPFDYKEKNYYYKNLSVISFKPKALKNFFLILNWDD